MPDNPQTREDVRAVEQIDRDAAAEYFAAAYKHDSARLEAQFIREGKLDGKALVQAFARHRHSALSTVNVDEADRIAWARLETWGEAQKLCQHGLDGLTFAKDVSEERKAGVRSGVEACIALIHDASRHDPKSQPTLGSLPAAPVNVDALREALEKLVHENGPICLDMMGENLGWWPLDYGTWTALSTKAPLSIEGLEG